MYIGVYVICKNNRSFRTQTVDLAGVVFFFFFAGFVCRLPVVVRKIHRHVPNAGDSGMVGGGGGRRSRKKLQTTNTS